MSIRSEKAHLEAWWRRVQAKKKQWEARIEAMKKAGKK